jgi:hypothetical protein
VYDEVHYLRDTERGVVWEESIILAPKATRMAFLSATLPNSAEFAGWVAATHGSPVHVVYTEYRPTPLQHYMFPAGGLVTTVLLFVASCFGALLEALSCVLQHLCQLVCVFPVGLFLQAGAKSLLQQQRVFTSTGSSSCHVMG